MTSATEITNRIIEAVIAQKLAPGSRLGEQQLAMLFDCSRTVVREALARLSTRGIVTVSARRGWYLVEPSQDEAREAFEARRVVESGLIRSGHGIDKAGIKKLKNHLAREKAAIKADDIGVRTFLLGDFHVCLAECLGNSLLADTLRDFTARTALTAMLYQSSHDAVQSCADHVLIVQALEKGDLVLAEQLMNQHIGNVQTSMKLQPTSDPIAQLREALAPVEAQKLHASAQDAGRPLRQATERGRGRLPARSLDTTSTYLGALL